MTDDIDFFTSLLNQPDEVEKSYTTDAERFNRESKQKGPLRYFDAEMRCASKGCSSPTHYKFRGIPYCTVHCLRLMNEELTDAN